MQHGGLKDRWGLCWQVTPARMYELLNDADPERARRAMTAMMTIPVGVGCLIVGLFGVCLQFGTSAAFKERLFANPGWELFRDNLRRAWLLVFVGAGIVLFESWAASEKARISRETIERLNAIGPPQQRP